MKLYYSLTRREMTIIIWANVILYNIGMSGYYVCRLHSCWSTHGQKSSQGGELRVLCR
jgi:hypothetical protein